MSVQATWEPLEALEAEWRAIQPACAADSVFLSVPWQRAWADVCCGDETAHPLLAVRRDGALLGIAPLHRDQSHVSFAPDPNLTDYQDILALPGEERTVWTAVLDHLAREGWRSLQLTGIRADHASAALLPELAAVGGWRIQQDVWDVAPGLDLPGTWDEYLQRLSKKDRHELRRKLRRLEASGQVSYTVLDGRDEALPESLATLLEMMRQSHEDKARFLTPQREAFLAVMAQGLAQEGHLRLVFLDLDGTRIAGVLCFLYGDELLLYNSGYDPAYRSLSAGLLVKAWCTRYAIEGGLKRFDFLRGDEPYKYDLGGTDRAIHRYVLER